MKRKHKAAAQQSPTARRPRGRAAKSAAVHYADSGAGSTITLGELPADILSAVVAHSRPCALARLALTNERWADLIRHEWVDRLFAENDLHHWAKGKGGRAAAWLGHLDRDDREAAVWRVAGACAVRMHPSDIADWLAVPFSRHCVGAHFAPAPDSPSQLLCQAATRSLRSHLWTMDLVMKMFGRPWCWLGPIPSREDDADYAPVRVTDPEEDADPHFQLFDMDMFSSNAHQNAAAAESFIELGLTTHVEWLQLTLAPDEPHFRSSKAFIVMLLCFHGDWESHTLESTQHEICRPYSDDAAQELGVSFAAFEVDFSAVLEVILEFGKAHRIGTWQRSWTFSFVSSWTHETNFFTDYSRADHFRLIQVLRRSGLLAHSLAWRDVLNWMPTLWDAYQ